jgi:hypothetical protein
MKIFYLLLFGFCFILINEAVEVNQNEIPGSHIAPADPV